MILKVLNRINRIYNYLYFKRDRLRLLALMKRGLKVGKNVYIFQDVEFDLGYPYLIEIGDNCRIGKDVLILAHDATPFKDLGITRLAPVKILEGSFIGQKAIILPGVTIGPRAIVAAGSVVNRSVPEGRAVAGNPARPYTTYAEILERIGGEVNDENIFDIDDLENSIVTAEMIIECSNRFSIAFVKSVPRYDPFYVNTDIEEMRINAKDTYARFKALSGNKKKMTEVLKAD
jgi:maltose O-acetyltransferase